MNPLPILEAGGVPQVSFSKTWGGLSGATFFNGSFGFKTEGKLVLKGCGRF